MSLTVQVDLPPLVTQLPAPAPLELWTAVTDAGREEMFSLPGTCTSTASVYDSFSDIGILVRGDTDEVEAFMASPDFSNARFVVRAARPLS